VGLGVARAVAARRAELAGRIKFVFQPAEEAAPPPGQAIGAEKMVQEGVLEDPAVDAAFALHVMPLLDVGSIGFTGGPVWAASDLFDIHVTGAMAHGAYPHEGRDPILAAAAIVQALQQIPARVIDAREACVLSVCRVTAGTAYNIIPDTAHLQGLLRTLDENVRDTALETMRRTVEATAAAHGCTASLSTVRGTYLTANHPALERFVGASLAAHHPDVAFVPFKPQMGAEDFAAFSRRVPGCYLFLGVRNEARGITSMIHTPTFDVDEACLELGVRAMTDALLDAGARWDELAETLEA
jgi:amidohydrolase